MLINTVYDFIVTWYDGIIFECVLLQYV